jgi:hypothetical protein
MAAAFDQLRGMGTSFAGTLTSGMSAGVSQLTSTVGLSSGDAALLNISKRVIDGQLGCHHG